jgi:thymidylate synthase ThyX
MTITATIIADSISPEDVRLTTMQLRYPKFIHGEFMTHRVFSRNASSSRAIPVLRLTEDVERDPAMPVFWGSNKPGMQAGTELTGHDLENVKHRWLAARDDAVKWAQRMLEFNAHKQIVNRIIEPWCHINVVVTATEWANFYALRRHPDAQPEMKALADAMWATQQASTPTLLQPGKWHLPYVNEWTEDLVDRQSFHEHEVQDKLIKLSVARCARVSYLTHEGKSPSIESDLALYDRLVGSVPLHASPAEHQATPDTGIGRIEHNGMVVDERWNHPHEHGNLTGWRQFRRMLPNESVRDR